MNTANSLLRLHYDLRTLFTRYPIPYLWLKRFQQKYFHPQAATGEASGDNIKWGAIEKDTAIVIEGYPRSGNTFASSAFRLAQDQPVKIAYRLHAPTQLIVAAKIGIPAIALIRKPEDAVLSWVIHRSHLNIEQALKGYISFHEAILPYCDKFVIADFDVVVSDFASIIRAVNSKYGTNFQEFVHTEENVQKCFGIIDDFYSNKDGQISSQIVARPSSDRKKQKAILKEQLQAPRLQLITTKAEQLYQQIIKLA